VSRIKKNAKVSNRYIPMPTDRLHKTFVKGRRRSGQGKDKMSVDWLRYSGGTVYACGPGRHTITKNIDIMTPGQAQFSSVTLHVGNQGEKEGGDITKKSESRHRNYIIVQLHPCAGGA